MASGWNRTVNAELDRDNLEVRWQANERQLNRIAAAPALDREICAAEVERIEAEQDRIEFLVGFENPGHSGSRCWSGLA
jgi:hypothetical protein